MSEQLLVLASDTALAEEYTAELGEPATLGPVETGTDYNFVDTADDTLIEDDGPYTRLVEAQGGEVRIPGGVPEARLVHGAFQSLIEQGKLEASPVVESTQAAALVTMQRRMTLSMSNATAEAIDHTQAAVFDNQGVITGYLPVSEAQHVQNDAETDDAVAMSPEDMWDDDEIEDAEIDLQEQLRAGRQEIKDDINARSDNELAIEDARSNRTVLEHGRQEAQDIPTLTPRQVEAAIDALQGYLEGIPAEDSASRLEIIDTLAAFKAEPAPVAAEAVIEIVEADDAWDAAHRDLVEAEASRWAIVRSAAGRGAASLALAAAVRMRR